MAASAVLPSGAIGGRERIGIRGAPVRPPRMDAARFGSIHQGDDSHRGLGFRDPRGWTTLSPAKRSQPVGRDVPHGTSGDVAYTVWSTAMIGWPPPRPESEESDR